MTYKEAMSFNRKLTKQIDNNEIEFSDYIEKRICLYSLARRELLTDEGLPAQLKANFHAFNENGIIDQMGDLRYANYSLRYLALEITELALKNRVSPIDVQACINGIERTLRTTRQEWGLK